MIQHRTNEIAIVEKLRAYLSTEARPCEVVRQNQVAKAPPYPYVSYTVTTPIVDNRGTYCESDDGTLYKNMLQTWSFTLQSDDADEALTLGMKMYDYFSVVGLTPLTDDSINVHRVTNLTTRDNLLTIQYEHRQGLDVTFGLLSVIEPDDQVSKDKIETMKFKEV